MRLTIKIELWEGINLIETDRQVIQNTGRRTAKGLMNTIKKLLSK